MNGVRLFGLLMGFSFLTWKEVVKMKRKFLVLPIIVFLLVLTSNLDKALAGCGCDHPPPEYEYVLPSVIWPGMPVNLYSDDFDEGNEYTVRFGGVSVTGTAAMDGEWRMRVRVELPEGLPLGPTPIWVDGLELSIPSSDFTVISKPYVLPGEGKFTFRFQNLGVDADGVVYLPLDLSAVIDPVHIRARLMRYPLRIEDFGILNAQGYYLDAVGLKRIIPAKRRRSSDVVVYDRHSFETYYADHEEKGSHALSDDPDYHLDGTPHIEHELLILAIGGHLKNGTTPEPGATRNLHVKFRLSFQEVDDELDEGVVDAVRDRKSKERKQRRKAKRGR